MVMSLNNGLWDGSWFQQCCIKSTSRTDAGLFSSMTGIGG